MKRLNPRVLMTVAVLVAALGKMAAVSLLSLLIWLYFAGGLGHVGWFQVVRLGR